MLYNFGTYALPGPPFPPFTPAPGTAHFLGGLTNATTTEILISGTDAFGNLIPTWLTNLSASTNSIKGSLRITVNGDVNKFVDYQITGNVVVYLPVFPGPTTGNYGIPVTFVADSSYTFNTGDSIVISFARAGDVGATGATGSVTPFIIDYQIIPNPDTLYGIGAAQAGIYYSAAFTWPSCNVNPTPPISATCSYNEYTYNLSVCRETPTTCGISVATHLRAGGAPPSSPSGNCQPQSFNGLRFCDDMKLFCTLVDGPNPPTSDAFIEWYWAVQYNIVATPTFVTGKLTFMATYDHILTQYNANVAIGGTYINPAGAGNVGAYGIPLFNPSNHNQT
jgi:hypothetical protein